MATLDAAAENRALLRDPARLGRVFWIGAGAVLPWPLAVATEFQPWALFAAQNLRVSAQFLGTFLPPALDPAFLAMVLPQVLSYTPYRWENNVRAAAVLGVVGAGGLGQLLQFHMGLFHMGKTATILAAMLLLVVLVDALSYAARRALNR